MTSALDTLLDKFAIPHVGKFSSKLSFDERCTILAFIRHGIPPNVIALTFGVHRRTLAHIRSQDSPHYKEVRAREIQLGTKAFIAKYATEEAAARILATIESKSAAIATNAATDEEQAKGGEPRRFADKYEGTRQVRNEFTSYVHTVVISWSDEDVAWGWQDLDGGDPTFVTRVSPEGEKFRTSTEAFNDASTAVEDPLTVEQ